MTLSRRSTIKTIGVLGAGSALTGTALARAQEDDEDAAADDEELGAIRVGHFSPDAPAVDVYVDGQAVLTDVQYGDLSPYLDIVPDTYSLTITEAGDEEAVVYENSIVVDEGYYTAAAVGELEGEPTDADSGAEAEDDPGANNESDTGANESNSSANETDGDLEVSEEGSFVQENESALDTENETDGNETDGNETAGNETSGNETDEGVGLETVDDEEDAGADAEGTFEVLVLADEGPDDVESGTASLRLVHASPDAPAVDVAEADTGRVIFEDVSFPMPSGYRGVEPDLDELALFPADETENEDGVLSDGSDESDSNESNASVNETDGGLEVSEESFVQENETDENESDGNETDGNETDGNETDGGGGLDGPIEQPEPAETIDVSLEEDRAYTVYAFGYFEADDATDAEEDRSFETLQAVDGERTEVDESTAGESETDDGEASESDDGADNGTDESGGNETAENGNRSHGEHESATADD
ncbi:DUF4397 domain-containing protein [Natrialbaceae archaeon GCM10025810]|uniref:DUF4397 domain-containing protein n=1 Tax=Halovalidus salilacus TaxID=3075124 RepID=UPI0036235B2E